MAAAAFSSPFAAAACACSRLMVCGAANAEPDTTAASRTQSTKRIVGFLPGATGVNAPDHRWFAHKSRRRDSVRSVAGALFYLTIFLARIMFTFALTPEGTRTGCSGSWGSGRRPRAMAKQAIALGRRRGSARGHYDPLRGAR